MSWSDPVDVRPTGPQRPRGLYVEGVYFGMRWTRADDRARRLAREQQRVVELRYFDGLLERAVRRVEPTPLPTP